MVATILVVALSAWCHVSLGELVETCKRLSPSTFVLAFFIHLAIHALRAQRVRTLIPRPERPPYFPTFAVASASNLASYVLPAKTGEVALVVYLKSTCDVSKKAGLAALLVSRVLDLSTLAFSLAVASFYLAIWRPEIAPKGTLVAGALCLVATIVLSVLAARADWVVRLAAWFARFLKLDRTKLGEKILARSNDLAIALRQSAGGVLLLASLQSMGTWIGIFFFYAVLARGFGLPPSIGLGEATLGAGFAVLSNLLPINSFAGAGTQELGWVFGFKLIGVDQDLALTTGVAVHAVQLANTIALGLVGHLGMAFLPRKSKS